jgi:hypothetical protein
LTLLLSYEQDGSLYETSAVLSLDSVRAEVEVPLMLHAKLVETDQGLYALLLLREGVAVLDLQGLVGVPSFWTEERLVSLCLCIVALALIVKCLPYMQNGHRVAI